MLFLAASARELALLAVTAAIRFYRRFMSPLLGPTCRYTPTCSEYALVALRRDGLLRGGARALARIARCHPWARGGHDPP